MPDDSQSAQLFLDTLTFIFERWEFLLGLLVGGGGTYTTITLKKKNQAKLVQRGDDNQGTQIIDSPNASPQTGGRDVVRQDGEHAVHTSVTNSPGAVVNVGGQARLGSAEEMLGPDSVPATAVVASLDVNQSHILQKVQEILTRLNVNSSFSGRYPNAISHLNNNNAQVCASEYHAAFLDIVSVFQDRATYGTNAPSPENLTAVSTSFEQIRTFMSSASHDHAALRTQVRTFEDGLIVLLGYL